MSSIHVHRRLGLAAAAAAVALLAAPLPVAAEDITLRFSGAHPPVLAYGKAAKQQLFPNLKSRAKELGHNLRIIEAWAGSAVGPRENAEGLSNGVVDIATVIIPFEQAAVPLFAYAYTVPFGPPDTGVATRVGNRLLKEIPELQASIDRFKITGLSKGVSENYGLLTKFPVTQLTDLKGHPIAAAGPNAPWVKRLGAASVPGVYQGLYQDLQTGVISGVISFLSPIIPFKLYDQTNYYYRTNFGAAVAILFAINNESMAGLPAGMADVLREESDAYATLQGEIGTANDAAAEAKLKDLAPDFKIVKFDAGLRREWAELLKDLPNAAAQRLNDKGLAGTKVWQAYLSMLAEEGYKTPVEYVIE